MLAPATDWADALPLLIPAVCSLVLALGLPIGILMARDNVKTRRQGIIKDLGTFFTKDPSQRFSIIPSFEFVKSKYYVNDNDEFAQSKEIPIKWYSLSVLAFISISFSCFFLLFCTRYEDITKFIGSPIFLSSLDEQADVSNLNYALTISLFAFLGSYTSSIKTLIRSVSNFDLSPMSFFRSAYNIIFTISVVVVAWHAIPLPEAKKISISSVEVSAHNLWYGIAFTMGFVPGLAERYLLSNWHRGGVKDLDESALKRTKSVPLELIEGIDADIRARLEDFNLYDVQNLATANPIMLFVETPYGIYQSIDWVSQAQLATAVGIDRYIALRNACVRNVFDLERIFLFGGTCVSTGLQSRIADILLKNSVDPNLAESKRIEIAKALVCMIVDDLAVLRLRQIWMTIEHNLNSFGSLKTCSICRPPIAGAANGQTCKENPAPDGAQGGAPVE